ncbi:MAG: hypothetical protein A2905_06580 [Candidatus Levybacteria bacterium RIFCSPLOWO2_01_FULL_36_10]|nr:MAG: hypothetical protein A2905_06580 [Candidatus Levybacteria bacterium RIFCSPLOWO2_01_FULL_36_10]
MNLFTTIFTTREQAIIIWVAVFLMWSLFQKNLRNSLAGLVRAFFQNKILAAFLMMVFYVGLTVYLLFRIHLWNIVLVKDTIFWIIGTAFILFLNLNKAAEDKDYFKKILLDNLKFILILTFLINFYTLPLIIELITLPIIVIIVAMSAYAGTKKEYLTAKKFADFILSAWGIFLIIYATTQILSNYQNFFITDNFLAFLLPILLTLVLVPFLYGFAVYMTYESLFSRIDFLIGKNNKQLASFGKRKILKTFILNLKKLNKFSKNSGAQLLKINNEEDLIALIRQFA